MPVPALKTPTRPAQNNSLQPPSLEHSTIFQPKPQPSPQDKKEAILAKKQSQWEYLCSSYVFHVRHKDPSQFNEAMASIGAFNFLIKEGGAVYRTFTIIDDDIPLDDGYGGHIILGRCRQKFSAYSSSLKYLIRC